MTTLLISDGTVLHISNNSRAFMQYWISQGTIILNGQETIIFDYIPARLAAYYIRETTEALIEPTAIRYTVPLKDLTLIGGI